MNDSLQYGEYIYMHAMDAYRRFTAYPHVMPLPCRNPLQRQLPRLSQDGPHSGLCLQVDYPPSRQGKTIRDKPPPQQLTRLPISKTTPTPETTGRPLALCRPPQRVSPCKPFPNPSRQSINLSINKSHTHACSANQYSKQLRSPEGTPSTPPLIYTKTYLCLLPSLARPNPFSLPPPRHHMQ
jgi:hypothetical protein